MTDQPLLPTTNGHDPEAALLIEKKAKKNARSRAHYELNKEEILARREKQSAYKRAWFQANIARVRAQRSRPEARAKKNGSRNEKYRTDPVYRERDKAQARADYEKHRESRIAGVKAYYERTRDQQLAYRREHYQTHKEEYAERQARWDAKNPDKLTAYKYAWLERNRESERAKKIARYDLTYERYLEILTEQNGVCAICKNPEDMTQKKTGRLFDLCVDHDHSTGKVRGLLCGKCNTAIGMLGDNAATVFGAWQYLLKYKAAVKGQKSL